MNIKKYSLDNNLNIYIKKDTRSPVILSQIWYKVGSTYEPPKLTGISHMLEHMMFKSTNKYSKSTLNNIVESRGGIHNAFTSFDYTVYYQFWHKKNIELSFSIEASRMINLIFNKDDFIIEKKVILEERNLCIEDKILNYASEKFMQLGYQKNARHTPIIGWKEDIKNYKIKNLQEWYKQNYAPNNSNIILIGDIDINYTLSIAKNYFSNIPKSQLQVLEKESSLFNIGYRHLKIQKPLNNTAAIILGYITPSLTTEYQNNDPFALLVLNSMLGNDNISILQQKLIKEQNICCYIKSEYSPFIRGEEIFTITGILNDKQELNQVENKIKNIINNLKNKGINNKDLNRAKINIKSNKIFSMDYLEDQAYLIGSLASINLDVNYYQYLKKIYNVTTKDIYRILNKYFNDKNLASLHLLRN